MGQSARWQIGQKAECKAVNMMGNTGKKQTSDHPRSKGLGTESKAEDQAGEGD